MNLIPINLPLLFSFIVFKGLDDKNITEVVFLEVKTGSAGLNRNEKMLKKAINEKNVRYVP